MDVEPPRAFGEWWHRWTRSFRFADDAELAELAVAVLAGVVGVAGLACADPWASGGAADVLVDADHAGGEASGEGAGLVGVGEDDGAEAVFGVVGEGDGFVLGVDGHDAGDGAEGLLGHDAHVVGEIGEDGGLEVVSIARRAGVDDLGASLHGVVDLVEDVLLLPGANHGADPG